MKFALRGDRRGKAEMQIASRPHDFPAGEGRRAVALLEGLSVTAPHDRQHRAYPTHATQRRTCSRSLFV